MSNKKEIEKKLMFKAFFDLRKSLNEILTKPQNKKELDEIQDYFFLVDDEENEITRKTYSKFKEKYPSEEKLNNKTFEILFRTMDGEYICSDKSFERNLYLLTDEYVLKPLNIQLIKYKNFDLFNNLSFIKEEITSN